MSNVIRTPDALQTPSSISRSSTIVNPKHRLPHFNISKLPSNRELSKSVPTPSPQTISIACEQSASLGSDDDGHPFGGRGNFVTHGFQGLVDFTKSGMSFGEKFTYGLYDTISKWSKKWFTHMFLLTIVTLYSIGGAVLFRAIEGHQSQQEQIETHAAQKSFFKAMQVLASDHELLKYNADEFNGQIVHTLRVHQSAIESLLNNNKSIEEMAKETDPWSFWNAMFYCGTIYTTIDITMEYSNSNTTSTNIRRRRRLGRHIREQTPDPNYRRQHLLSDNNSKKLNENENEGNEDVQTISMQIRAPRPISSHESKILRRRDKGLANAAMRSQSQPRIAEKVTNTAIIDALKYPLKRSLSTPRKSEVESSDAEILQLEKTYSTESNLHLQSDNGDNLSRLQRNMQRFEKERRRLQSDKLIFEIEKCEHKLRCKQLLTQEERRRLIQNYRKLSSQFDREQNIENEKHLDLNRGLHHSNSKTRRQYYDESSTQLSSSESLEGDEKRRQNAFHRNIENALSKTENSAAEDTKAIESQLSNSKLALVNQLSEKELSNLVECNTMENVDKESEIVSKKSSELPNGAKITDTTNISVFQRLLRLLFKNSLDANSNSANKQSTTNSKRQTNFIKVYFQEMYSEYRSEFEELHRLYNTCIIDTIILILLIGFGGLLFRYTEGSAENVYKCEVRKVKRDFIEQLWINSHNMREDDWKFLARQKLRKFEDELHNMRELGIRYFPGQKSWNFVNSVLYCWAVITTVGYGHITPKTTLGQSLTIVYAIIGIPMFLILLADFGKLFTRVIKFVWGFIRRLYYTGTCRKIRKQQHMQDAMTGFTVVYDMAKRRSSHFLSKHIGDGMETQDSKSPTAQIDTPTSIYPGSIIVDDEFNLPISLASILLISYILIGAFAYTLWEEWTYFEAFYFVFISMSTIGFGDFVPDHPIFMMCSIIYMVFGLALTSMFINVVQIKLSDTFKQASTKIGATIGLCESNAAPSGMTEANEINEKASQGLHKTPSDVSEIQIHTNATLNLENGNTVQASSPTLSDTSSATTQMPQTKFSAYRSYNNANIEETANAENLLPKEQIDTIKQGKKTKSY